MAINYTSEFTGQHNDDYDTRITSLLSTINEQQNIINTLTEKIAFLENQNLLSRITTLENELTKTTNINLQYSTSGITVHEYLRYSKYGKIVIVDIGGIALTDGNRHSINFTNLPIMRNRIVALLMNDSNPGPNIYVGYCYNSIGTTTITFHIPNSTRVYGQFCYLTD